MSDSVKPEADLEIMTFNEVQLLLAEKRTSLSTMRTGIAVFLLFPLSVLSVLIATSKSYELHQVMQMAGSIDPAESWTGCAGHLSHHAGGAAYPALRQLD